MKRVFGNIFKLSHLLTTTRGRMIPKDKESLRKYVSSLKDSERCMFMSGLDLDLCDLSEVECVYQGKETYSLRSGTKKECRRPKILRLKKLLGKKGSFRICSSP